jgi:RecB family exonuclease
MCGDDTAACPVLFHLTFSGIIDRLDGYTDQYGRRHYRIVDYKTGNADSFRKYKLENKKGYQTTQHAIYQMYASQSGSVDLFEYHFPFEEEEGNRRIRIREFGDPIHGKDDSVLQELHNSFVRGDFPPKPKTGGCGFCNYSDICLTKIQRPEE